MRRDIKACAADATVLEGMRKYTARRSEAFIYIFSLAFDNLYNTTFRKTQGVTKHSCKQTNPASCLLHSHVWKIEKWENRLLWFDLSSNC